MNGFYSKFTPMKELGMKIVSIIIFLFTTLNINAQEHLAQDQISRQNQEFFHQIVVRFKSNLFRGRAQNFSSFNLDLDTFVHLNQDHLSGVYTFNLASNGNPTINGVPVWPIAGRVETQLTGEFQLEGERVELKPRHGLFYFVESQKSYNERVKRWDLLKNHPLYQDYLGSRGRLVGVANIDLYELEIEFYEWNPATGNLVRAGVVDTQLVRR